MASKGTSAESKGEKAGSRRNARATIEPGPGILPDLDRLIHERMRLGIMSALSVNRTMSFAELKELLATTDGNLSKHARRLEDAGLVSCKKAFAERVPRTQYSLTAKGKRAFAKHLEHMEALIRVARSG